jgi:hypothetical protein
VLLSRARLLFTGRSKRSTRFVAVTGRMRFVASVALVPGDLFRA